MYQPLPNFAPLYPPVGWWRLFLKCRLEGADEAEALERANRDGGVRPREWLRFGIAGGSMLSIPVTGGASALKNRHPSSWILAPQAAREGHKAFSSLATIYGRTPFFHLLVHDMPVPRPGECAAELCCLAFRFVALTLNLDDSALIGQLRDEICRGDSRLKSVSVIARRLLPLAESSSILDPLFRMGPDAIFALIPPF